VPDLTFLERPLLKRTIFIAAFAGWADAAEAASGAIDYMVRRLQAREFAAIDPEKFLDFTEHRPDVRIGDYGERVLDWPEIKFYYWRAPDEAQSDIVLFRSLEPCTRWKRFADLVTEVADACDVRWYVTLGALLDAVPHTRAPRVTGSTSSLGSGEPLGGVDYGPSTYEGPTGISSVIAERLARRSIPSIGLWGHAPHYVQASPNPGLTCAILTELLPMLPVKIDLDDLKERAREFSTTLERALADQADIEGYVHRLEERYDSQQTEEEPGHPDPAALLRDLDEFLRQERSDDDADSPD